MPPPGIEPGPPACYASAVTTVKPEEEGKEVTEKLSNGGDKTPEKSKEAAADSENPATPDTPASPESATESSDKKQKDKSKKIVKKMNDGKEEVTVEEAPVEISFWRSSS
uniref:Uncharacterized protein n=1 Tax=Cacopsylla melanoneura TaxID=428564 RepID=A0A8D8VZC9_9HEMI